MGWVLLVSQSGSCPYGFSRGVRCRPANGHISKSKKIKASSCREGSVERGQDGSKVAGQSHQVQGMFHVF